MKEEDEIPPEEKFSDNPQENLQIENEILRLKMQAEYGAIFGRAEYAPPEIENEFLLNVLQFEEAFKNVKYVKVRELIGKPRFKNAQDVSDQENKS